MAPNSPVPAHHHHHHHGGGSHGSSGSVNSHGHGSHSSSSSSSSSSSTNNTPEDIRRRLDKVLQDQKTLERSARATFRQFDADGNGRLDFNETRNLVTRLCRNLQLPPIDDETLKRVIANFDDGDLMLTFNEFVAMYYNVLQRVRDRYYPSLAVRVRRDFFVQRQHLEGRQISEILKVHKKLGAGSFGEVHLVTEKSSGFCRVCKTINKDKAALPVEQINAEIEFMKKLDHPNIIKIFEVYEDFNNIYIIMETCEGGELMDRILEAHEAGKTLNERYVATIMRQLFEALAYCHDKRICHKDLKPENIMFHDKSPDSNLKVIDFGVAEMFKRPDAMSNRLAGTALYMAPEVYQRSFTLKCDVWSAGCIMYFLLTGRLPFVGKSIQEMKQLVLKTEPNYMRDCRRLSTEGLDLLKVLLRKEPTKRPSATEVLKHRWFATANISQTIELSEEIEKNMKMYMKQSGLKHALVNLMAHQLNVSGSQIRKIIKLFHQLDADGNGELSQDELKRGLTQAGWEQWNINRVLNAIDIDGNNSIQYTEFLAACYTWRESELNVVWTAFSKMDKDKDGRISIEEFKSVLAGEDPSHLINPEELEEMIRQIDRNGDGMVEWDEFLEYVRGG